MNDKINVEHMGVSPSHAKSQKGNHVFPNTSEQSHETGLHREYASEHPSIQQQGLDCEEMAKNSGAKQHETESKNFGESKDEETSEMTQKKYMLRSLTKNDKASPSNLQEKSTPSESINNSADVGCSEQRKRRGKKKEKREVGDEYSRIKGHLRYLLNRINYEQSLIAAYSTEGSKGLSLDMLKPEEELQRATSEIIRCKLKIRHLFRRIGSLCAEGKLPESLFDSEGQIDSENIFCAKCGSKDLSPNNDIILCDGGCDRGFHQDCLQPPLLKEDIPPGDEGWLCPGCDCKVDCIEFLNQSQGTSFSLTENWEKVFPEAAVSADEETQDPNFVLPSDDNDYIGEKDQEDESSSEEIDFTSNTEQLDEDFDPNDPHDDNVSNQESSSSYLTSDFDDCDAMLEDNVSSKGRKRPKSKRGGKESLQDELLSLMESSSEQDGAVVSRKRGIERLDYKKLYDETYGNVPSSSSEDEDWSHATTPRKRMKCTAEMASKPSNGNASEQRGVDESGSDGKISGSSTQRRLGEAVKQRLYDSFKKIQYPNRSTKENLAKELEITFQQVSKWFDNARWNFNKSSSFHESATEKASEKCISSAPETEKCISPAPETEMYISSVPETEMHISSAPETEMYISSVPETEMHISSAPETEMYISSVPETEMHISSAPETEMYISSAPETEKCVSSTPETEKCISSALETENCISSTPETKNCISSAPETEKCISSAPETEKCISPALETENCIFSAPETENCIFSAPEIEMYISSAPETENCISSALETENCISSALETENCISSAPEIEKCTSSAPETENCISSAPETENCISLAPEAENCISLAPETENCISSALETENCISSAPEIEKCTSSAPETENCIFSAPETENCISLAPETENCISSAPETEKCISTAPETEKCISTAPETEKCISSAPKTENCISSAPEENCILSAPETEKCISSATDIEKFISSGPETENSIFSTPETEKSTPLNPATEKCISSTPEA